MGFEKFQTENVERVENIENLESENIELQERVEKLEDKISELSSARKLENIEKPEKYQVQVMMRRNGKPDAHHYCKPEYKPIVLTVECKKDEIGQALQKELQFNQKYLNYCAQGYHLQWGTKTRRIQ